MRATLVSLRFAGAVALISSALLSRRASALDHEKRNGPAKFEPLQPQDVTMAADVHAGGEFHQLQATTDKSTGGGQLHPYYQQASRPTTYDREQAQKAAGNEEQAAPPDQQQLLIPAQAQAPEEALRLSSSTVGASLLDLDVMNPPLDQQSQNTSTVVDTDWTGTASSWKKEDVDPARNSPSSSFLVTTESIPNFSTACIGSWSDWSDCMQTRRYRIYTVNFEGTSRFRQGAAQECPHSDGFVQYRKCYCTPSSGSEHFFHGNCHNGNKLKIDCHSGGLDFQPCGKPCEGAWHEDHCGDSADSRCNPTYPCKPMKYRITSEAEEGGKFCVDKWYGGGEEHDSPFTHTTPDGVMKGGETRMMPKKSTDPDSVCHPDSDSTSASGGGGASFLEEGDSSGGSKASASTPTARSSGGAGTTGARTTALRGTAVSPVAEGEDGRSLAPAQGSQPSEALRNAFTEI